MHLPLYFTCYEVTSIEEIIGIIKSNHQVWLFLQSEFLSFGFATACRSEDHRQSILSALDMSTPKTPFIYPSMQIDMDKLKVYPKLKSFKNLLWLQRRFFLKLGISSANMHEVGCLFYPVIIRLSKM